MLPAKHDFTTNTRLPGKVLTKQRDSPGNSVSEHVPLASTACIAQVISLDATAIDSSVCTNLHYQL